MRIVIIGGGIIGLTTALALQRCAKGDEVYLLEQEKFLGHHTSTRNSEVIHSGFAYPPGSLKSRLCVKGLELTYNLLNELGVPYKRCGKWIVAVSDDEVNALYKAIENARLCGASGVKLMPLETLKKSVPQVKGVREAAFSKDSGIMDAASYIKAIEARISQGSGVNVVYPCRAEFIDSVRQTVSTTRGEIEFDILVNAAGLEADDVYEMATGVRRYQIVPFKGEYYIWKKGTVNGLVYPVPSRFLPKMDVYETLVSSMGVHIHRSVGGELYVGPSQIQGDDEKKYDYAVTTPPEVIVEKVSRYMGGISVQDLSEAFAGNRPKLFENGRPIGDFQIFREGNIIHLLGIESPGLTAAPAIAEMVLELIESGPIGGIQ